MSKLVRITSYYDLPAAQIARAKLESAGINCELGNEHIVGMNWLYTVAVDGIELCVWEEDAEAAAEILAHKFENQQALLEEALKAQTQSEPDDQFAVAAGKFTPAPDNFIQTSEDTPACPKCGSQNSTEDNHARSLAAASMLIGVPLPLKLRHFRCNTCGKTWK